MHYGAGGLPKVISVPDLPIQEPAVRVRTCLSSRDISRATAVCMSCPLPRNQCRGSPLVQVPRWASWVDVAVEYVGELIEFNDTIRPPCI